MGKDTTIGHWEIAGIISPEPLPTYPDGFPEEVISEFEKQTGRKTLCNKPYSGTEVIRDFGQEHVKTGDLIVYTSADSVFQIAAHEDVVPVEELYRYCGFITLAHLFRGGQGLTAEQEQEFFAIVSGIFKNDSTHSAQAMKALIFYCDEDTDKADRFNAFHGEEVV